ncbi:BURP domain-containing protein precursor [Capsicum annuum]|nr:BURP domain-containing protein precursor [Capsicum annuum]
MMPRSIMAIEEHNHSDYTGSEYGGGGTGSGGNSRPSKKVKAKKVPQRGLGVAQLERIRMEGEKNPTPNVLAPNKCLVVECPTFRPKNNPLSPPSTMDLPSKSCVFTPNVSALVLDGFRPKEKTLNVGGGEVSWSSVTGTGSSDKCPILWSCEFSPERESQQGNRHGLGAFGSSVDLPNALHNPILPLPSVLQRSLQYQQSSCSSSMMNISSGISSSSSVLNYQMEPPSNQNYYSCNYLPLWPEDVKMVGMKRPYPFSPDFPPVPAFQCKFPPGYVNLSSRSPESASCSNECAASLESGNLLKREAPSGSWTLSESKPRNVVRQKKALNGDFLTLALPTAAFPYQHSSNSTVRSREILNLESVTCQGVAEEPSTSSAKSRSVQQPIYGFFPTARVQISQEGTNKRSCHVEVGGNVDLNLKL